MNILFRHLASLKAEERERLLRRSKSDIAALVEQVRPIVDGVRERGDEALRQYTLQFDKADLKDLPIQVTETEIDTAPDELSRELRSAIEYAIENVRRFHESQRRPESELTTVRPGIVAGERTSPIESAGLYVPRGRGTFPSMLYMLAVPASIAGVDHIAVATPPGREGEVDPACLYAAHLCGVHRVYRVGGAQAISALAYGTESVVPVRKIVGPGSAYVAAAKQLVSERADTGLPAGPTESMVLADGTAEPRIVALDLAIEAEHGMDSAALLVTDNESLARAVEKELPRIIEKAPEPRKSFLTEVFSNYGGILLADTMAEAIAFVNEYAPEHIKVQTADPWETLSTIRNAGEILLGEHTAFSLANYAVGANAVLPTGGYAHTWSPVSVQDFTKRSSVVYVSGQGYRSLRDHVISLADHEGFYMHAQALRDRGEI
jgi:histidinol dehydrogenase